MPAVALLLALAAPDEVASTTIAALSHRADAVLIGTVVDVVQHGGRVVVRLQVERAWKGGPAQHVAVLASPTWACDASSAARGERALFFLDVPQAPDGVSVPPALSADPLYEIAWSGRGRLPIERVDGAEIVLVEPAVRPPKRWPTNRHDDERVGRATLADVVIELDACVGALQRRASCDDAEVASIDDRAVRKRERRHRAEREPSRRERRDERRR